jgi:hypothetical protein
VKLRQWAGAVVGVGGLLLLASLVMPWFEVPTGTIDREGFFHIFPEYAPPAAMGTALAALGVAAALAGACSALGLPAPRPVHGALAVLLLAAFAQLGWVLIRIPRVPGFETLIAPSPGFFFALAGPLVGAAGSLVLARAKRPPPDDASPRPTTPDPAITPRPAP